jgi:hypothetical protein
LSITTGLESAYETAKQWVGDQVQEIADTYSDTFKTLTPDSSDKTLAYRTRIGKQTALILSLKQLLSQVPANDSIARSSKVYNFFCTTNLNDNNSTELSKKIFKNNELIEFFDRIPSNVLSNLLPSIEIYKTIYIIPKENEKATVSELDYFKESYDWRIPFDDMSTTFGDYTSEYVLDSVDELLKGTGRLHGVGIKSFSYKFAGSNPAEVNSSIECELELFFQNIEDTVKRIDIKDKNDPRFGSFKPKNDINTSFSYSDLVNIQPRLLQNSKPNINYFQIKVVLGYTDQSEEHLRKLLPDQPPEYISKLKKALDSAKIILNLTPHNSDLSFEENGSATLKIQYVASIDILMQELDIFGSQLSKLLKFSIEGYESTVRAQRTKIDRIKQSTCNEEVKKAKVAEEEEQLKKIEEQKNKVDFETYQLYQQFYEFVIKENLYEVTFDAAALGTDPSYFKVFEDSNRAATDRTDYFFKNGSSAIKSYRKIPKEEFSEKLPDVKLYEVNSDNPVVKFIADAGIKIENLIDYGKAQTYVESADVVSRAVNNKSLEQLGLDKANKTYKVKFVYFGDILESLLRRGYGISITDGRLLVEKGGVNIIIGEISIKTPSNARLLGTFGDYEEILINLANMPIALDFIEIFFFEKIIKPRRKNYPLLQFIKDFLTEMVIPAISPTVFGRNAFSDGSSNAARISNLNFSLPLLNFNGNLYEIITRRNRQANNFIRFEGTIDQARLDYVAMVLDAIAPKDIGASTPAADYFYVYCSSEMPKVMIENAGDYEKDKKSGILHFSIGTDSSLIKKISFSRNTTQFYKEMRATNEGNVNLTQLKETYDISSEMFGNNIFRPGDFIYIEPLFFQNKKAIDLQEELGIGGYYQVLEVKTSINENVFQTSINASLIAHLEVNKEGKKIAKAANKIGGGC